MRVCCRFGVYRQHTRAFPTHRWWSKPPTLLPTHWQSYIGKTRSWTRWKRTMMRYGCCFVAVFVRCHRLCCHVHWVVNVVRMYTQKHPIVSCRLKRTSRRVSVHCHTWTAAACCFAVHAAVIAMPTKIATRRESNASLRTCGCGCECGEVYVRCM